MNRTSTRLLAGPARAWDRFFFAPQEPEVLAACRIAFFGALFVFYLPQDLSLWGDVHEAFWMPIFLFDAFHIPVLSSEALTVLDVVWKGALLLSCLGLATRWSTWTVLLVGVYLLGLPHNMGKTHHHDAFLIFLFAAMAFSRCGDAWSLDAVRRRRRGRARPAASGEYRWPQRAAWVVLALVFFAAGVAKIKNGGLEWVFSGQMGRLLIKQHYFGSDFDPMVLWGLWMAEVRGLGPLMAGATVVVEAGYPLALFFRRTRWVFIPGAVLMLVGIRVLMGPSFIPLVIAHVFWIPWRPLIARVRARSAHSEPNARAGVFTAPAP